MIKSILVVMAFTVARRCF